MTSGERFHVWTVGEIQHYRPAFGEEDGGWFYGLVRERRRLVRLAEILPGEGYTAPFWRDVLRHPLRVLRDLAFYRPTQPIGTASTNATHVTIAFGSTAATPPAK